MSRLEINQGETYTVTAGETEEWAGATVEGTLQVDGTLLLIDDPDTPTTAQPPPEESPTFTDLLNPERISFEFLLILSSIIAPFVYLTTKLRSAILLFMVMLDLLILLLVILVNLSFIWFWIAVVITAFTAAIASMAAVTR